MDALILAGGQPVPGDLLYEYTKDQPKPLLDIGGKPMIQWLLETFDNTPKLDQYVIVGLDETLGLKSSKPIHYVPDQGDLVENLKIGTQKLQEINPQADQMLISTADIPTVTPEMVTTVIDEGEREDQDIVYFVVEQSVMEKRFPGANRTFLKLRGAAVCGADMNVTKISLVTQKEDLWNRLAESRKNPLKQASMIGFDTLFLILFRIVDLEGTARQASKRLGIHARAVFTPFAELAMDVDKPHQLEIIRKELSERSSS
jgi:GTP:adenosylcobinamide-phosphate guanylyltransferase